MIKSAYRAIACAIALSIAGVSGASATTVLSLPDAVGHQGSVVQVPISASSADGVFGIDMTITYNPAVLTAQDVTVAGIASSANFVVIRNLNTPGTIVISMFGPQAPLAGSGEIARVHFLVAGATGTSSPLAFSQVSINEGHIASATDDGSFSVTAFGATLTMPDTAQGGPAAVVQVPISVNPGTGILGIDLTITYDSAVLTAQDVTVSGIGVTSNFSVVANVGTPGVIYATAYANGGPMTLSGEFASIQFLVEGNPGDTSSLTFTSASINEDDIPATVDHGFFTVTCAGAADGTPCTDGESVCTPIDTCQSGVCVGAPLNCDDGNPCTVDSCTNGVGCQLAPGNAGATCRASTGPCDVAESCTGLSDVCPADAFASSATVCTGTSEGGACDATDHCSGTGDTCVDEFQASGFTCRTAAGDCDVAETCSGSSGACPIDGFQSSGFTCRTSAGPCDVSETCTGSSALCPSDAFASSATVCTGSSQGGACDAIDHCSGSSNVCVDEFQAAGFSCRTAAGDCDVAETCSGSSGACPIDGFQSSGFTCRTSAGPCDVAETCTGSSALCPTDAFASSATACTGSSQGGACDAIDHCSGSSNVCVDEFQAAGFSCRTSAGDCDVAETCSGSSGACPIDGFQSSGFTCRTAAGPCDLAETCTGSSALCPSDAFASSATVCTGSSQGGACDVTDHCSGSSNVCLDEFQAAGFTCRNSAGQCDVAESCTGTAGACPADGFVPNGTSCNDADATTCTDVCTGGACAGTPVAEPAEIDDSIVLAQSAGTTNISWGDAPGPYNVYRGTKLTGAPWLYNQTCLAHETALPAVADPAVPPPNTLVFYLVSRVDSCRESILGHDSTGAVIPNNNPCPNPPADTDGDGSPDIADTCPLVANVGQADADADGHGDVCDNCAAVSNVDQGDEDLDTIGDACDPSLAAGALAKGPRREASPLADVLSLPDTASGGTGTLVQVPISVAVGSGIFGIDMTITYNPAVVEAQEVTVSGVAQAAGFALVRNLNTPGTIIISTYATQDALGVPGEIASIRFHVLGAPGATSALTFTSASINEGGIPVSLDHGLFTVNCSGTPNGTACNDGNSCTANDACQAGVCTGVALQVPTEVANVAFGVSDSTITWTSASGAGPGTVHDVVRGVVGQFPVGTGPGETCFATGIAAATVSDVSIPPASSAYFYLVRGRNACATGTYGFRGVQGTQGAERTTSTCP